jgi:uncharacterized protein with GYD domain
MWNYLKGEIMLWVSYGKVTQEGIKGMIANPENRAEPVGKLVEALGGKLVSYHLLLNGDIDFIIVSDIPDDKIANIALITSMLVRGSGAIESVATVPAVTAEDAVPQMQKAQERWLQPWHIGHRLNRDCFEQVL